MGKGTLTGALGALHGHRRALRARLRPRAIERADLIVTIGHDTVEKPPFIMGRPGPTVIHVGYPPADVEQVYFPQTEVVGDIGPCSRLLADRLEGKLPNAGALLPLREASSRTIAERADRGPLSADAAAHRPRRAPGDAGRRDRRLDNGMYKIWFARNYRTARQHAAARQRAGDHGRGAAVGDHGGAALPEPPRAGRLRRRRLHDEQPGDGDRRAAPAHLVVLIIVDHAYGMIRWKQALDGFADFGMTFGNPDFVRYAEAYGAKATRVAPPASSRPALEKAFPGGGVHLVVVPVDYSENRRVLVDELAQRLPYEGA